MKHLPKILAVLMFAIFAGATVAYAQSYTPLAPLPGTVDTATGKTDLTLYLAGSLKLLIALGAGLAVLFAVIGGTQYVAASINPSAKADALGRVWGALIGLTIILASYLLLNSINPKLVEFDFMLPPVGVSSAVVGTVGSPAQTSGVNLPPPSAATPSSQPSGTSPAQTVSPAIPVVGSGSSVNAVAQAQEKINKLIDRNNDYSIISYCVASTTYDLCPKTDLNKDGKTDIQDVSYFITKGSILDVNQNKTLEILGSVPDSAKSCFLKISTAGIHGTLPRGLLNIEGEHVTACGGEGFTSSPTVSCNGATWIKYASLGSACASEKGLLSMPLGYVHGANGNMPGVAGSGGQYTNLSIWIKGASSGNTVNLPSLFVKAFLNKGLFSEPPEDPYYESDLGKIAYATVAQYDLNNDGSADFAASGADMALFDSCRGEANTPLCVQADFNTDGMVDSRDLGFVTFIKRDILGGSGFIPVGWKVDWFESMMFDPTGYSDKQIINYCVGHKAFEKCGFADVNSDRVVNSADVDAFNTEASKFDFNNDGIVNLK